MPIPPDGPGGDPPKRPGSRRRRHWRTALAAAGMAMVAFVSFTAGELKEHYLHHTPPPAVVQMRMPPVRYEDPEELMTVSPPPMVPAPRLKFDDKSCDRLIRAQYEVNGRVEIEAIGNLPASWPARIYAYDVKRSRPSGPDLDIRVNCVLFERGNSIRIEEAPKSS